MFYSYECDECGHTEEKKERIGKPKKVYTCPACEKVSMYRLIGKPSFKISGGGVYDSGWK